MTTGLVFGKFMPVHAGHLALIDFAYRQCDHLIVSMSYTPEDPIPADLRRTWLTALLAHYPNLEVVVELDDFHDDALPIWEATKAWATFIRNRFPTVRVFFASEAYGPPLALHSGLTYVPFDPAREQIPVSATLIRANPEQYRAFIPAPVLAYLLPNG